MKNISKVQKKYKDINCIHPYFNVSEKQKFDR